VLSRKFGFEVNSENMKFIFVYHGKNAGMEPNI